MISSRSTKLRMISPLIILFAVALMPLAGTGDLSVQAAKPIQPQEAPRLAPPDESLPPGTSGRPPEMDLSHLTGQKMPVEFLAQAQSPPASWDWRTQGKVTSVKDQGACGSCYAFATIGNIESKMLIDGAGSYDFSENSAKECNWRELNNYASSPWGPWGSCDGGNYDMLANLFSQKGVVFESCNPYVAADVACNDACPYQITLLDWRIISGNVVPNTELLKNYIQTYGPVYTRMYMDPSQGFDSSYDGSCTFNYITPAATGANHCVLIVGWSNDLPPVPGGTVPASGWIVKNSWGTGWGDDGYFYMTYNSANIGMNAAFMYDWQYYDDNGGIMYYDDDGWSTAWGWSPDTTGWGLAKFFPASDTNVTRVEFWTTDKTTDIDVYIYDNFSGTAPSNLLWSSLNHGFNEAGYHGITVDPPLAVDSGDDVIAVVKFTNDSYAYPIPVDVNGPYVTGRTYTSHTGASGTWYDLGAGQQRDVAIRLRTSAGPAPNNPPNAPSNPSPANHATGILINADPSWTGGDPDPGDTVTYDVYFGTSATPPLVSNDQTGTTYDPGALTHNTKYYWNIVATDNHGASTTGPLWDFTTVVAGIPDITVSPTSFDVILPSNTLQSYNLTIANSGGAPLTYDISDRETTSGGGMAKGDSLFLIEPASAVLEIPLQRSLVEPDDTGGATSGWQNIMTENFEGVFPTGLWAAFDSDGATNGEYYWDDDDYKPHWGSWSAWCASGGANGLDPALWDYPNNMNAWMVYGPFDLSDATDAELNFYCWLQSEEGFDYFEWMASPNGSAFYGWRESGDSSGWQYGSLDLSDVPNLGNLCGQTQVWIAFTFQSDSSVFDDGPFLDDIELRKYVSGANNPPNVPSNPSPTNHATGVSLNADFSWTGGDPDPGDTVIYDVYFGTSATPPLVSSDQTGTTYDPGTLACNTKYYWWILATDNSAASMLGPLWDFTTTIAGDCPWLDENTKSGLVPAAGSNIINVTINTTGLTVGNTYTAEIVIANNDPDESPNVVPVTLLVVSVVSSPPNIPSNPSPADNSTGVLINADLSWSGGDPDAGDTVIYDVYFGTSSPPPLKEIIGPYPATQSSITYDPGTLVDDIRYYWQIVARDNHGITVGGPVWDFTTGKTGDVNNDDHVNILDMVLVGQGWGQTGFPGWIPGDVMQDGVINVLDMVIVGQHWTG